MNYDYCVDSHCHLQNLKEGEREEALDAARERGVRGFLIPATKLSETDDILEFCHRHEGVWCALGTHPHDASSWQDGDQERLASYLGDPKCVAVGECGLDFHYDFSPRDAQDRCVREQWELAIEHDLPVVVHNRDSNDEMVALARDPAHKKIVADFHSFAGGLDMARELLEALPDGAYFGMSGMITFKRADNVREVLPHIPRDRILVETDTPFLAPVPYRGKPNRPAYVVEIAERLATEWDVTAAEATRMTTETFFRLYPRAAKS